MSILLLLFSLVIEWNPTYKQVFYRTYVTYEEPWNAENIGQKINLHKFLRHKKILTPVLCSKFVFKVLPL